tara:strand:- start:43006 stop:43695 length:690 start_codon:yes stop_codon:yes gene_type:complete
MNYIGIDISINSTAVYIENKKNMIILSFTNKKENNKYIEELSKYGVIFHHIHREKSDIYSDNEIFKLNHYINLSKLISNEIIKVIDNNQTTYCNIEGFSFSKNTSSILDIVSLSTLIKSELIKNIEDIKMSIISPSSLKLETCKLVYKPINIGKKKVIYKYINNSGISGGSFKKHQMFEAIIDGNINNPIFDMLVKNVDILKMKKIPNPIEDIIDAIFACKIKMTEISI